MDKIISPLQGAFILGRSIHDNILLKHKIMLKFKNTKAKKAWAALKIDVEKAYDRLEWDLIIKCFMKLGFHQKWIDWIKEFISTVSYSLLVNGAPSGFIKPSRGIRQGDPLSPYIFIICLQLLSIQLLTEAPKPNFGIGVKLSPRNPKIPCLMFADDCLIFSKTNFSTCSKLKGILNDFCVVSGQMINFHKPSLTFSKNTSNFHKQLVSGIMNITRSDSLGKYLGCPGFQGKPKASVFQDLLSRTMTKVRRVESKLFIQSGEDAPHPI